MKNFESDKINPYKLDDVLKEKEARKAEIEQKILEAEDFISANPDQASSYQTLIEDMKQELEEIRLVDEYSDEPEFRTALELNKKASQLFSKRGKDSDLPEIQA